MMHAYQYAPTLQSTLLHSPGWWRWEAAWTPPRQAAQLASVGTKLVSGHIPSLTSCAGAAQVKMVTGDQRLIAIETCRRLGMGTNIMEGSELVAGKAGAMDLATKVTEVDGFAGVYPEHKHRIVSALQSKGRLVGMTGVPNLLHMR